MTGRSGTDESRRQARLSEALKANLKRRKEQGRERSAAARTDGHVPGAAAADRQAKRADPPRVANTDSGESD